MDINYLLYRAQVERMRAERAACEESRNVHEELAESYRDRVDHHRQRLLADAGLPNLVPPPL